MLTLRIGEMHPTTIVLPIFGFNDAGQPVEFLGTGFLAGKQPRLVTCHHVVATWAGDVGIVATSQSNRPFVAKPFVTDSALDIALFTVAAYHPDAWLSLAADQHPYLNLPVISLDYAGSGRVGDGIELEMNTRRGNVIKMHTMLDRFGPAGEAALELSYPAIRGASGSPVLSEPGFEVWGVVRDNVMHQLHQSHLERTFDDEGNEIEDAQYYMPAALAIHVMHLRRLLDE